MEKVILAAVHLKDVRNDDFDLAIEECKSLCEACNVEVIGEIVQNSNSMDLKTAFRSGKISELQTMVETLNPDTIIFYNTLRIQVAQRIQELVGIPVMDRTGLILHIFSLRARSKQAKIQVEMARLQYDLPRVLNQQQDVEHMRGGGAVNRGGGEMRSQIISRKYQARISDLKQELKKIEVRLGQDERRRAKTMMKRVALVGYTNAGKSSLMNTLLAKNQEEGSKVFEADMLFATLDTSVRTCSYGKQKFLLYDTVGFVSDLPHTLIEAFKSTLSAAKEADLLVHVVDISDPHHEQKKQITLDTLKEIGASDIPMIQVYNKIDLVEDVHEEGCCISCKNEKGMKELLEEIISKLYPKQNTVQCLLPYAKMDMFNKYQKVLQMEILEHQEDGILLSMSGPQSYLDAFKQYQVD